MIWRSDIVGAISTDNVTVSEKAFNREYRNHYYAVYVSGLYADNKAVKKVFEIKKRSILKPLSILVGDVRTIDLVAKVSLEQKEILNNFLPGPYTFILNKRKIVPRAITGGSTYVGVRVPDNQLACRLSKIFPITTTSANLSDEEVLPTPEEILEQLERDVDLVIDVGKLNSKKASTVINLTTQKPRIIRK